MQSTQSVRSLLGDLASGLFQPQRGCIDVSCATHTGLRRCGGRYPPEDCVRYALSTFPAAIFVESLTGFLVSLLHKEGNEYAFRRLALKRRTLLTITISRALKHIYKMFLFWL